LQIAGSLGLFLYGMRVMGSGIQKAAGERLHTVLQYMTGNRFYALMTGFFITSLIQSSSATTVMIVSFANAGLLSVVQAIGVIMGANIGTTITGWIVALLGFKVSITAIALPVIGVGLPLLFVKRFRKRDWGEALVGFGILFLGLRFLKDLVPDIRANPEVLEFLSNYTGLGVLSFIIFVAAGTLLTVIVQSSSAAMAITLTMAYSGWIDYTTAAAIVLGENIGTTVTAYLASLGTSVNARRAARVHLLFNVMGVFWIAFLFRPFLTLVDLIIPGSVATNDGITSHIAMFHTLFNVANSLLFIWFVPQLAALVSKIVKDREKERLEPYRLKYISTAVQSTPELNIMEAKKELSRMAGITGEMFDMFLDVFNHPNSKMAREVEELKSMEDYTDQMQEQISQYLVECAKEPLNEASATNVKSMIRIAHELEGIGDSCYNLILLAQRRYDNKIAFHEEAVKEMEPYSGLVREFIDFNSQHLGEHLSTFQAARAYELEERINGARNILKEASRDRLQEGRSNIKAELFYIDILGQLEKIGDHSLNISQELHLIRR
jgi:phosphate:Na+ symporter